MKRIMFVSVILMLILLTASCITFPSNNGKPNDEINLNDYFGQEITISFWHAMGNSDYDILGKIQPISFVNPSKNEKCNLNW